DIAVDGWSVNLFDDESNVVYASVCECVGGDFGYLSQDHGIGWMRYFGGGSGDGGVVSVGSVNTNVTRFKLVENGFTSEFLALMKIIELPINLTFSIISAMDNLGKPSFRMWSLAFKSRLAISVLEIIVVAMLPTLGLNRITEFLVVFCNIVSLVLNAVMGACLGAFFSRICDPVIGGTYLTLLNTFYNLGETWPTYFSFEAVEHLTLKECITTTIGSNIPSCQGLTNTSIPCTITKLNANTTSCRVLYDGFILSGFAHLVIGSVVYFGWMKGALKWLEEVPLFQWRVRKQQQGNGGGVSGGNELHEKSLS
ncbi:hypothetical protein HDU76_004882, partial [Blyttiomyces sp. JEL0837]